MTVFIVQGSERVESTLGGLALHRQQHRPLHKRPEGQGFMDGKVSTLFPLMVFLESLPLLMGVGSMMKYANNFLGWKCKDPSLTKTPSTLFRYTPDCSPGTCKSGDKGVLSSMMEDEDYIYIQYIHI